MIPKIIHYCWFGKKEIPPEYAKFINNWQTLMPDYEFRLWNETNIPQNLPYLNTALSQGKWANASNLVRLHALLMYGGFYLDTDVQVLKRFDYFLRCDCMLGFEREHCVNNAIIGAIPNHPFIKDCYLTLLSEFDGTEQAHLSSPVLTTKMLQKHGMQYYGRQRLCNIGVDLFPKEFFYPYGWRETFSEECITDNTYAVHHWSKTWQRSKSISLLEKVGGKIIRLALSYLMKNHKLHKFVIDQVMLGYKAEVRQSLTVKTGPFRGIKYPSARAHGSSLDPKLLGTYEYQLHKVWYSLMCNQYDYIIDIGCAEGYYLVGLAQLYPTARIIGYDTDKNAVETAEAMLKVNHLQSRVTVKNTHFNVAMFAEGIFKSRVLIVCDAEGYEKVLFTHDRAQQLSSTDLVIELHDFIDPEISPQINSVFCDTHKIEIIDEAKPPFSYISELEFWPLRLYNQLSDEHRPSKMEWAVITVK